MKMKANIIIAIIAAGTTMGVYAEEAASERPTREERRAKILERSDKDGDGQLSKKERAHAKKLRAKHQEKSGEAGESGEVCKRGPKGRQRGESGERGPKGRQRGERDGKGQKNASE